jgi:hypothetical protein
VEALLEPLYIAEQCLQVQFAIAASEATADTTLILSDALTSIALLAAIALADTMAETAHERSALAIAYGFVHSGAMCAIRQRPQGTVAHLVRSELLGLAFHPSMETAPVVD